MRWKTTTNTRPLLTASVAAACLLSLSLPAAGGNAPARRKSDREPPSGTDDTAEIVRIYALINTDCRAAMDILNPLLAGTSKGIWLVPDARTNSLIARGTASTHQKIEQLLKAIDRPRKPVAGKEMLVSVYPLRYAEADGVARAIAPLIEPVGNVTADASTRSLVVSATAELHDTVKEVIAQLDTKPRETGEKMIVQAYPLKHAKADKLGAAVLPLLGPRGTLSRDMERNLLIIKDVSNVQQTAARLIEILDVPAPAGALTARRVRVVWLAGVDEGKRTRKLPPDLKEVEAELAKAGFEHFRVLAQFLATCVGTEEFRASGEVEGPCRVSVQGQFVERSASAVALKIAIAASQLRALDPQKPAGEQQYVDIATVDTTITAPPGHAVVLAMCPMLGPADPITSIFVVITSEGK